VRKKRENLRWFLICRAKWSKTLILKKRMRMTKKRGNSW
jgi:hypothetical protein